MFAEDVCLLPDNILTKIIDECAEFRTGTLKDDTVPISYDLIGNLFFSKFHLPKMIYLRHDNKRGIGANFKGCRKR
jgi:hypothetical protein